MTGKAKVQLGRQNYIKEANKVERKEKLRVMKTFPWLER